MKKILMLGLITALCLSGCGSKPAESKTESVKTESETESKAEETNSVESEAETESEETEAVDITGRELFSITVGDETLDLTTCTVSELFKLLQKTGLNADVKSNPVQPYGMMEGDIGERRSDGETYIFAYNPSGSERSFMDCNIYIFEIDYALDKEIDNIKFLGGQVPSTKGSFEKYIRALDSYGISYEISGDNIYAEQVANNYGQIGKFEVSGDDGRKVYIELPRFIEE